MLTKKLLSNIKVRTSWRDTVLKSPINELKEATYSRFGFDLTSEIFDIVEDIREMHYNLPIYGLFISCQPIPLPD